MSDDERLERLTELARRVPEWADKGVGVQHVPAFARARVLDRHGDSLLEVHSHPHALDALEAALLVLCADVTMRGLRGAVLVPMLPEDRHADWVEQLAAEWEDDAAEALREGADAVAYTKTVCADELRERAKGGERG